MIGCGHFSAACHSAVFLAFAVLLAICFIGGGIQSGRAASLKSLLSAGPTPTEVALFADALPDGDDDLPIAWLNGYEDRFNSPKDENPGLTEVYAFNVASPIVTASTAPRQSGFFESDITLKAAAGSGAKVAALTGAQDEAAAPTMRERLRQFTTNSDDTIVGIASMYNPYDDNETETAQTASGEIYDPLAWTAAIQIDLRHQFGGVRYGRLYQPAYVLVESGDKRVIVKINDVGPLRPGRIIDFNERTMRYFDPTLRLGLIKDVRVTLLPGEDWITGPVASEGVMVAGAF